MKEALTKIQEATNEAANALRPALGQRHRVAGTFTSGKNLYNLILKAEHALLELQEAVKEELAKQNENNEHDE